MSIKLTFFFEDLSASGFAGNKSLWKNKQILFARARILFRQ